MLKGIKDIRSKIEIWPLSSTAEATRFSDGAKRHVDQAGWIGREAGCRGCRTAGYGQAGRAGQGYEFSGEAAVRGQEGRRVRGKLVASGILAAIMAGAMLAGAIPYLNSVVTYSEDSSTSTTSFNFNQSVSGTGFYNIYRNITEGDTGIRSFNHGSGAYIYDVNIAASGNINSVTGEVTTNQKIDQKESMDAVYSKATFDLPGSMGAIPFNSPISDSICIKNYFQGPDMDQGTSMNAKFLYAESLKKDLGASLYWNTAGGGIATLWEDYAKNHHSKTSLNVESEFSGKAHIGAIINKRGDKHPIYTALVDEDYSGAFTIAKKMSVAVDYDRTAPYDDWLPCCSGGWNTMDIHDKIGHGSSATGIFDCTCYKVPQAAEFQREGK